MSEIKNNKNVHHNFLGGRVGPESKKVTNRFYPENLYGVNSLSKFVNSLLYFIVLFLNTDSTTLVNVYDYYSSNMYTMGSILVNTCI